jgi:hypothetical protein
MDRICKIALMFAIPLWVLSAVLCLAIWRGSNDSHQLALAGTTAMQKTGDAMDDLGDAAWDSANVVENLEKDVATLSDAVVGDSDRVTTRLDRVLIVAGGAAGEFEKTSRAMRTTAEVQSKVLDERTPEMLDKLDRTLDNFVGISNRFNSETLPAFDALLTSANTNIVANPELAASIKNLNRILGSTADIGADLYKVEHKYFFPPKQGKFKRALQGSWFVVKEGSPLHYYWQNSR